MRSYHYPPRNGRVMEDIIVSTVFDGKQRKLFRRICAQCGIDFYAPKHTAKKFCGIRCFETHNAPKRVTLKCDNCGIEFSRCKSHLKKSKSGLRFCGRTCKNTAQRIGNYNSILRPSHYGDGRYGYRVIAFRNYPKRCNRCGYDQCVGILRVHHKDRNRKNNNKDNLEVLCPNCHEVEHYMSNDGIYTGWKKKITGP